MPKNTLNTEQREFYYIVVYREKFPTLDEALRACREQGTDKYTVTYLTARNRLRPWVPLWLNRWIHRYLMQKEYPDKEPFQNIH